MASKLKVTFAILALLLFVSTGKNTEAAGTATLRIVPSVSSIQTGQSFTATIQIQNGQNTDSVDATMNYPAANLTCTSITASASYNVPAVSSCSGGVISVSLANSTAIASGTITVATLNFTANAAGTAQLSVSGSPGIYDFTTSENVYSSYVPSSVTVTTPPASPPASTPSPTQSSTPTPTPSNSTNTTKAPTTSPTQTPNAQTETTTPTSVTPSASSPEIVYDKPTPSLKNSKKSTPRALTTPFLVAYVGILGAGVIVSLLLVLRKQSQKRKYNLTHGITTLNKTPMQPANSMPSHVATPGQQVSTSVPQLQSTPVQAPTTTVPITVPVQNATAPDTVIHPTTPQEPTV